MVLILDPPNIMDYKQHIQTREGLMCLFVFLFLFLSVSLL